MCGALGDHGATSADRLGGDFATHAGGPTLTFGVEEHIGVLVAAGAVELPVPEVGVRAGEAGDVGHGVLLGVIAESEVVREGVLRVDPFRSYFLRDESNVQTFQKLVKSLR
jgi:hypothetical protein